MVTKNVRYVRKRCYKNFDAQFFLSEVKILKWWDLFQTEDVDKAITRPGSKVFSLGSLEVWNF